MKYTPEQIYAHFEFTSGYKVDVQGTFYPSLIRKGNKISGDITLSECRKEIEHLNALLEEKERVITEKERTIQILIQKQK